ncbi:hypothetical protein [Microbacterium paraoxydans]|uniref:hypothetical protein n=1 Tax=Microbacterium paraoxydans TaxID=199592 RepID=UPI003D71C202
MMSPTPLRLVAVLALGVSLLSGCTPTPESTPTPSPAFTSEEEAFAAAEATFSEYIDALNRVDFSDPATFEGVFSRLSGQAAESTRRAFSQFHAEGVRTSGRTRFSWVSGVSADADSGGIQARVCIDVSEVDVVDSDGASIVAPDRPALQPTVVTFAATANAASTISDLQNSEEFACAS